MSVSECHVCGYDLSDVPPVDDDAFTCPECGTSVRLDRPPGGRDIGNVHLRFLFLLTAPTVGLPLAVLVGTSAMRSWGDAGLAMVGTYAALSVFLLPVWCAVCAQRIRRRSHPNMRIGHFRALAIGYGAPGVLVHLGLYGLFLLAVMR